MTIKARVRGGRFVVDEPTDLPDGTELELLPLDPGDWLDEADRAALHEALAQSQADVDAAVSWMSPTSSSACDHGRASPRPVHRNGDLPGHPLNRKRNSVVSASSPSGCSASRHAPWRT
jgi:hypothetical protein